MGQEGGRLKNVSEIFVKVSIKRKCHVDSVILMLQVVIFYTDVSEHGLNKKKKHYEILCDYLEHIHWLFILVIYILKIFK